LQINPETLTIGGRMKKPKEIETVYVVFLMEHGTIVPIRTLTTRNEAREDAQWRNVVNAHRDDERYFWRKFVLCHKVEGSKNLGHKSPHPVGYKGTAKSK
jgi:hypothetical protein